MKAVVSLIVLALLSPTFYAQTRANRRTRVAAEPNSSQSVGQSLPVRRVVLYSNGVAYFERRGRVRGRAEISLSFKQSQVDDVLKSMVVLDLGRGRIGAVSYNSSAPASARLAEIPFSMQSGTDGDSDSSSAGGMSAVLKQLQGARVAVSTAARSATGAVINVEERKSQIDADKPPLVTQSLVIASESGEISAFNLAEVRSIKVLDEGARKDLNDFAAAAASARRRDAKTIVVTSEGEGEREMVVSYTVAAPIWKTTYRVVIDSTGKPFFQGWAIVDNVSDEDWTDVRLSLVSGTPISFIQPLQQPLYRYRPVIPIPTDLNLEPQIYEVGKDAVSSSGVAGGVEGGVPGGIAGGVPGGVAGGVARGVPPPPASGPVTSLSDAITDEESGVEAVAEGNQVGDLFEYRIDQPMTVRRDRSALIPILQTRLEGERVSIFNESAGQARAMSGIQLKNTSELTFEGGSMTVIDGDSYAGEALIERLKPGEERFITFALDLGTLITVDSDNDRQPAFLIRAINGVIQAHYYKTEQKTYTITNQTDQPRVVYVEHPKRDEWKLSSDAASPEETTENYYRFRVEVGPHETEELNVVERQALMDSYALSNLRSTDLELFVSKRYIDEATKTALDGILDIKSRIASLDQKLADISREVSEISSDQNRLRENIKALKETAEAKQLIERYVAKANDQETRMEQIASERKSISAERAKFQTELDNAIRTLSFDRRLEGK
jgi:hypothetical protein